MGWSYFPIGIVCPVISEEPKKPARSEMHAGFLRLQDSNGLQGAFLPVGA